MIKAVRFSPSRLALGYIALSVFALCLFAVPLWFAWQTNFSTFKTYVHAEELQRLTDVFEREGATGLAAAMESQAGRLPADEIMVLADASKSRLAGNLRAWPAAAPDAPGTYGLVIDVGGGAPPMRVVGTYVKLPGGYHLLVARESVLFHAFIERFWSGIGAAMAIVLVLGAAFGWLIRRALLSQVQEISRTAAVIADGDLSRRIATSSGSFELDTLARTVNGMLGRLAQQNVQLEGEVAVRRQAEQALHRAHDELERTVAQRTAQLALANESLRSSEERYARAMEGAEEGHWEWNLATDEMFLSDRMKEMLGIAPGERFASRGEFFLRQPIHPDDRQRVADVRDAVLSGATSRYEIEYRVMPRPGEVRWVRSRAKLFLDEYGARSRMSGSLSDITDRKLAEEALRESEERFALAVAGSNEGIFDWDLATDRVFLSPRAQQLTGLEPGETWRQREEWAAVIRRHPDDVDRQRHAVRAHLAGETLAYDVEFRLILPGGDCRWFRQRGIALRDARAKPFRMAGSIEDVTERHAAEEELRRLERQLRQAQRLEAVGTLAGGIAHDFNNILGAILGYGEMALRSAAKDSRLRHDLDSIMTAGERGRALVERILAFSRSGVGERVPVNVQQVVGEALDLIDAQLPAGVAVERQLNAARAAVLGDATQVHQVLMNLATNAVQAMTSGGTLRVSVERAHLDGLRVPTVGALGAGDYLVLEVADSGIGMPPDVIERIFDPFFTTKEVGVGTGLGLSLVHGIVAQLGGAIEVASAVGAGSVFTVYLPRTGEAPDDLEREAPEAPRGNRQQVLIVDDEVPLVTLATETLAELGYDPIGFTSSGAALDAFRAAPERFDAVITDERMPGMSGSALIREIRRIRRTIPILLMSGYASGAVAERALEAGADEVVRKPLLAHALATSLARVLDARRVEVS